MFAKPKTPKRTATKSLLTVDEWRKKIRDNLFFLEEDPDRAFVAEQLALHGGVSLVYEAILG